MDYKYIEQLLEQYWEGNTSLEEEKILRTFFAQKDVPTPLKRYQPLFAYQQQERELHLGDDFDAKILAQIDEQSTKVVQAQRIPLRRRLRPVYKAAAVVAILITVGTAANRSFLFPAEEEGVQEEEYATYQETYTDPNRAYSDISEALMTVSDRIQKFQSKQETDTLSTGVTQPAEETDTQEVTEE